MADNTNIVAQIIQDLEPGAVVTRYVLVAEIMNTDGERALWVEPDEYAATWETLGLLSYAIGVAQDDAL